MARTDNDSWEITESVGATALGVAAARAAETESGEPADQRSVRAECSWTPPVTACGTWFAAPDLPAEIAEAEPDLEPRSMESMVGYMASRTAFFDTFFLDAARVRSDSGGDPGRRSGLASVAVALARSAPRSTNSTSPGAGIQGVHVGRTRRRADLQPRRRPGRPAPRLADRPAAGRFRPVGAERLVR